MDAQQFIKFIASTLVYVGALLFFVAVILLILSSIKLMWIFLF